LFAARGCGAFFRAFSLLAALGAFFREFGVFPGSFSPLFRTFAGTLGAFFRPLHSTFPSSFGTLLDSVFRALYSLFDEFGALPGPLGAFSVLFRAAFSPLFSPLFRTFANSLSPFLGPFGPVFCSFSFLRFEFCSALAAHR